jgi:hypothetical protein
MKAKLVTVLAVLLCAATTWAQEPNSATPSWEGSGTAESPYLIQTEEHWTQFITAFNLSFYTKDYSGCHFRLEKDVSTDVAIGYVDVPNKALSGTLDGNGHTVTVNIESNEPSTALFRIVNGATIKNLHVEGTITTSKQYAAGLVGTALGSTTIENCRVSVKIISNVVGDGTHGGFVGINKENNGTLKLTGCVFDGQMLGANTSNWAGFVGWNETNNKMKASFTDCLFAPEKVTMKGGYTFFRTRNSEGTPVTLSNCYYIQSYSVAQSKAAYSVTAGTGTTVAMEGTPKTYNVSGITVFSGIPGYQDASGIHGGHGDALKLNLTSDVSSSYTTTAGELTGDANPYTLTMESADAVVTAMPTGGTYQVRTEHELRTAVQIDGVSIELQNDILLTNSTLAISDGRTVTIDLAGHTLNRGLKSRGSGGGQVITVRSGSTLILTGGTLTGGWGGDAGGINNEGGTANLTDVTITGCTGDDRGGGICNRGTLTMTGGAITNNVSNDRTAPEGGGGLFNYEGATATLTGVTITGNEAKVKGGGGICNYGTMTLDGCTIQHNICQTRSGGGIWNKGTLNMQGAITVTDNNGSSGLNNNVFLKTDAVITFTGALTGSHIGINMEKIGTFTSGFDTHHSGVAPSSIFSADLPEVMAVSPDANNEAQLASSLPEGDIYYIERSWDDENKKVVGTVKILHEGEYEILPSSGPSTRKELYGNCYYVKGKCVYSQGLSIKSNTCNFILSDGCELVATKGMLCDTNGFKLNIFGQANDTGILDCSSGLAGEKSGLGSFEEGVEGTLSIHGGTIEGYGGGGQSGIGFYHDSPNSVINIYGGDITAVGRDGGAGLGGGYRSEDCGTINIYGGDIYAKTTSGDATCGAGVGAGYHNSYGTVRIFGGNIVATANTQAAGVGCGEGTSFFTTDGKMTIEISGGKVIARGSAQAAGIGGGDSVGGHKVTISGGHVEAYGGTDAAGIGGGEGGNGGMVTITGGYVYAEGSDNGAGIGGGEDGEGGVVTISGGTVIAKAGDVDEGSRAIGPGDGCDTYGQLDFGQTQMVSAERIFTTDERRNGCWYRTQVRIEPCIHARVTYIVDGVSANDTHTKSCNYCRYTFTEKHTIVDGVCTVCGASAATYPLRIYLPKEQSGGTYDGETYTRTETTYQVVPNTTYTLPTCQVKVPGLVFKGWEVSEEFVNPYQSPYTTTNGGIIMQPGEDYVVNDGVSFIARYQPLDITLADNSSNSFTLLQHGGMTANSVTLSGRTLYKNGQWNTLCLPFNVSEFEGSPLKDATLMELDVDAGSYAHITGFDETTGKLYLNFKPATSIEAGKAYIVKWDDGEDITNPIFENVTINNVLYGVTSEDGKVAFAGIYSPRAFKEEDKTILYMGSNNKLYYPSQAMTINAFRGYFQLKGITAGDINNTRMYFGEEEDDDADGIGSINGLTPDPSLLRRGEIYNLSGQRLSKPQKGINIVNGKKVLY